MKVDLQAFLELLGKDYSKAQIQKALGINDPSYYTYVAHITKLRAVEDNRTFVRNIQECSGMWNKLMGIRAHIDLETEVVRRDKMELDYQYLCYRYSTLSVLPDLNKHKHEKTTNDDYAADGISGVQETEQPLS